MEEDRSSRSPVGLMVRRMVLTGGAWMVMSSFGLAIINLLLPKWHPGIMGFLLGAFCWRFTLKVWQWTKITTTKEDDD